VLVPTRLIAAAREAEEWVFAVTEVPQSVYEVETNLQRAQELERQLTNNLHAYRMSHTSSRTTAQMTFTPLTN
jgi:predicted alternative tryptophan synthase beta-subunit